MVAGPASSSVAAVAGFGSAVPARYDQQELWDGFFRHHHAGSRHAAPVWRHSGVHSRHGVVDPRVEDISGWGTGARMRRYVEEAVPLGKEALAGCLRDASLAPGDVDLLAVVSCTGYATPGLDILLARDLGLPAATQRLAVGHMGCYAALPGLSAVADSVAARGATALLLCLELTTLHLQPATDDPEQIVAHALFADAAAAVAVTPSRGALEVVDVVAHTDATTTELMTWDVTDLGFRMSLSAEVPKILAQHVAPVVDGLLARHGVSRDAVAGWAVHPGGPRIVDVVQDRLGLADEDVAASRAVLRDYGNCSSATVLLILERLRAERDLAAGDHVVALAFGPGLTLYTALLRVRGR
ncbi:MAG TPA: 3-oxoacyl-[acyl-carrier-protein] synthase III C-terminal domain-containing protein [Egibacteraceae bacterium]